MKLHGIIALTSLFSGYLRRVKPRIVPLRPYFQKRSGAGAEVRRRLAFAIMAVGATSIVAQIVLLRELIVVFYGNEISVGILLSSWFLLGAAGSLISAKLANRVKDGLALFCLCQLLLSAALPFLVVLVRHIKFLFGFLPGEIIPLGILAITGPLIIAPVSFTLGFIFALGCKIFPVEDPALKIGRVYILESVGAAIGGLFASFILIKYFSSIQILTGMAVLNMISCIALANIAQGNRTITLIKTFSYAVLVAIATALAFGGIGYLDRSSLEAEWRPLKVLISKNSIYGNVTVTKSGSQVSFFTNGLHNFTVPDQLSREESVHFIFSQHEDPKDILIIGGGAGGLLREILKYKVKKIDYIELDPLIIELARKFLPGHELDDRRLNIINTDGRLFAKNAPDAYDVVIISVPDPYTAQLNRFYTKEFFEEAKKAMRINGVLSIGVTSSENYISPELGDFLSSIGRTLKDVFADVAYIPGDTAYFMAAPKKNILTVDGGEIASKLVSRNISTGFVSADYLFSKLSKDRVDYMRLALDRNATIGTNHDFRPISYYYDMVLWSTYFRSWLHKVLGFINPKTIWSAFLLV
ncbi:MAG: fused MFS/spermidine synthase, partial [Candidatus Omnitrophota bacterium]